MFRNIQSNYENYVQKLKTSFINGEGASTVSPTCCSRWVNILVVDAQLRLGSRRTSFAHWLFYLSSDKAFEPQTFHLQGCFFELARVDLIIICSPIRHSPPGYFRIFFLNFAAREGQRLADNLHSHIAHTPRLKWQACRLDFSFCKLKIFRELKCSY